MKEHYTIPEFAKELGLHRDTVRKWIRLGHLKAFRIGELGTFRIPQNEVERIKKDNTTVE